MYNMDNYKKIIEIICSLKGIEKEELYKILKDRDSKYLLFLLLRKYKCDKLEAIEKDFDIDNQRIINYNIKKAKEKFLINKEFREFYFEIEKKIKSIS